MGSTRDRKAEIEALLDAVPPWRRKSIMRRAARITDKILKEVDEQCDSPPGEKKPSARSRAEASLAAMKAYELAENVVGKAIANETAAAKLAEALTGGSPAREPATIVIHEAPVVDDDEG